MDDWATLTWRILTSPRRTARGVVDSDVGVLHVHRAFWYLVGGAGSVGLVYVVWMGVSDLSLALRGADFAGRMVLDALFVQMLIFVAVVATVSGLALAVGWASGRLNIAPPPVVATLVFTATGCVLFVVAVSTATFAVIASLWAGGETGTMGEVTLGQATMVLANVAFVVGLLPSIMLFFAGRAADLRVFFGWTAPIALVLCVVPTLLLNEVIGLASIWANYCHLLLTH